MIIISLGKKYSPDLRLSLYLKYYVKKENPIFEM